MNVKYNLNSNQIQGEVVSDLKVKNKAGIKKVLLNWVYQQKPILFLIIPLCIFTPG